MSRMDFVSDSRPIRVLYIEGFSPGPGLPSPLLTRPGHFEVFTTRMPYEMRDICANPYLLSIYMVLAAGIWAAASLDQWFLIIVTLGTVAGAVFLLKRRAVGYCLDSCVGAFSEAIGSLNPDLLVGYSWGGGIAYGLLDRDLWQGATLLIAPAGEQMWSHAGRKPPTLRKGSISDRAAVLTIQGDNDTIVGLREAERLHEGARVDRCQLFVARGEDHFLRRTVTSSALERWATHLLGLVSEYENLP
mmetsp:Transcript_22634/g.51083  ORF Transcript_22634/g.51083 Transcript_22634/m.51083 type:complete len:246 (+) Transcript_22634:81-818(+)